MIMTITLKTLPEASAQGVFDQVKAHLLNQMEQSKIPTKCLYRGPEDMKCAAGCLMSDEEYESAFERNGDWNALVAKGCVPATHKKLIKSLQIVHDFSNPVFWVDELKQVAEQYNLNYGD